MASFALFARQPIDIWDQGMARLRGVEFDAPIVRATNRGAIGGIGALGRERSLSPRFGQQAQCLSHELAAHRKPQHPLAVFNHPLQRSSQ